MIREAIGKLVDGEDLTQTEAVQVMNEIMEGEATPAQLAGFITALRVKGETVSEIAGLARVMRDKALKVEVPDPAGLLDTCGPGGDAADRLPGAGAPAALPVADSVLGEIGVVGVRWAK